MPIRIQRKRTKGWKMPEGAVCVSRPSGWGNPFIIGKVSFMLNEATKKPTIFHPIDATEAVEFFRIYVTGKLERVALVQAELRGKDLACWCPLDQPCHADVLLEIANSAS